MLQEDDDPFGSYGLRRISLEDKLTFDRFFCTCRTRLSDYTFANTFIWRDSIHLRWQIFHGCLCVFANGDRGLTMLFPPLGNSDADPVAALRQSLEICESYNARANLTQWTRVEYVSQELMHRLGKELRIEDCGSRIEAKEPREDDCGSTRNLLRAGTMSGDYVYRTARIIDLAGTDLASKRQARNRFARRYAAHTEDLAARHVDQCLELLKAWREQSRAGEALASEGLNPDVAAAVQVKKRKEVAATADALHNAQALGLRGMVLFAAEPGGPSKLVGFTLGEMLDEQTCSIVIEKTNRDYAGSAQYIFSEFCRQYWSHTTYCNVGDDWEVPSLAWTKQSYRPVARLEKFVLRPAYPMLAAPRSASTQLQAV
jgi:hypothetical protein